MYIFYIRKLHKYINVNQIAWYFTSILMEKIFSVILYIKLILVKNVY